MRLDGVGLLQLGDAALHLPACDERHAVAEMPLRIAARVGERGGRGEERDRHGADSAAEDAVRNVNLMGARRVAHR